MQAITNYQAEDGSIWKTAKEAEDRDSLIASVNEIMQPLGERPSDTDFANGGGYIQHTIDVLVKAHAALAALYLQRNPDVHFNSGVHEIPASNFVRWLDGTCAPLEIAFTRLWCVDTLNREWGQVYFANHPTEGKQEEWKR